MKRSKYFDFWNTAKEMHVPSHVMRVIQKEAKKEFPTDQMMYELHVLRAIKSRYWEKKSRKKRNISVPLAVATSH